MISLIEALNYRCLKDISRPLNPFHVLVGPNGSGKSTFLDVISFLGDFVSGGLDKALSERTQNFEDLIWNRSGQRFELAIEASIPENLRTALFGCSDTVRYELSLGIGEKTNEVYINSEIIVLVQKGANSNIQTFFPVPSFPPGSPVDYTVFAKYTNEVTFFSERSDTNSNFVSFNLGLRKSALGNLPEDESRFPVSTWLKRLLSDGVQSFILNSTLIKKASPPRQPKTFKPDGSNLPWIIDTLSQESEDRFNQWISHIQTALPDIEGIRTVLRDDDRHRYLMIRYRGGLEVPSWLVSDGTLRLLALTLPAYLPDFKGIYLIEEPENGIHPRAIETVFQSLSSVYNAQILLATHSPVILGVAEAKDVLCFAKNDEGATDIISGDQHPALKDWKGQTNLGDLFASGVLG